MNAKFNAVKNHLNTHRAKYAAAGTLTACIVIQMRNARELNAFLDEHNLTDQYYSTEEI